jgi:hypothetical protein
MVDSALQAPLLPNKCGTFSWWVMKVRDICRGAEIKQMLQKISRNYGCSYVHDSDTICASFLENNFRHESSRYCGTKFCIVITVHYSLSEIVRRIYFYTVYGKSVSLHISSYHH